MRTLQYALVPAYLLHSLLYYHFDMNVIPDEEFDLICKEIMDNWDECSKHRHAGLLDEEALTAGSGYQIPLSAYPSIIQNMAYKIKDQPDTWDKLVNKKLVT